MSGWPTVASVLNDADAQRRAPAPVEREPDPELDDAA